MRTHCVHILKQEKKLTKCNRIILELFFFVFYFKLFFFKNELDFINYIYIYI